MLTLKAPLELKCNPAMISSHETFYHRITGNYGLLSSGIDKEDLLHVVTAPLELYLEEGGVTRIAQNTRIQNSQETKLEMINNVLNRITVMEEVNLTYQDRVFITDVLKKLGIREVGHFMKEVFRLKQETRTTERLVSLYWNHLEELRERLEAYHSQEKESQTVEERTADSQAGIRLYEEIMNRLQTSAIYQILNNFHQSQGGNSRYVTRQELQISEQKRTAVQVLLQKLRQEVRKKPLPLTYRHEDGYRQPEPEEDRSIEAWVSSQISSSVLLNLIDNLYLSLFERQQNRADIWLSMENALYQSAENTLYRLKAGFYTQWQSLNEQNQWNIRHQQLQEQEIHLAQALLEAGQEAEERFYILWNQYGEHVWQLLDDGHRSAEISYAESADASQENLLPAASEEKKEASKPTDLVHSSERGEKGADTGTASAANASKAEGGLERSEGKEPAKREEEQFLKAVKDAEEQRLQKERGVQKEGEKAEIHFLPGASAVLEETSPELSVKELARWVQEGREQFYRMAEQYLRVSDHEYRESTGTFRFIETSGQPETVAERHADTGLLEERMSAGKEQAEAADTVLLKWQGRDQGANSEIIPAEAPQAEEHGSGAEKMPVEAVRYEALQESLRQLTPQETEDGRALEIVHRTEEQREHFYLPGEEPLPPGVSEKKDSDELIQQVRQINRQNIERLEIYREIQKDMASASGKRPSAERDMRRDSLKALQDPEGLFREYEEERQKNAQEEQKRTETLMELLPVQTRRVYEKLEQYRNAQKEGFSQASEASGSMGLLLRDIHQAETMHKVTEQTRDEELRRIQETSETVLERWKEAGASEAEPLHLFRQEQRKSQIALTHKSTEHHINQEMLETLMEQNRMTQGKQAVTHEEVQDHRTVNRILHNETRQVVRQETEDLTELIQRGVRQQMGVLSEQIYSRLEKRLRNEKKRRGF